NLKFLVTSELTFHRIHRIYLRPWRADAQPGEQGVQRRLLALRLDENAAIRAVANPSTNTEFPRLLHGGRAEEYALDPTPYTDVKMPHVNLPGERPPGINA